MCQKSLKAAQVGRHMSKTARRLQLIRYRLDATLLEFHDVGLSSRCQRHLHEACMSRTIGTRAGRASRRAREPSSFDNRESERHAHQRVASGPSAQREHSNSGARR
ncbi:hypothetical protein EXIGLDRAFT_410418 [Exidia glandulosa HHB12029]|uniref:Uncharacterized protein n=1 Tax=Exidia glandulosa HHB12029 TaxID=1314781 RepID=A0A165KN61_EXIGL|nr:hypothetical protein EXIGLDRAFT_410418 [Exidia glandulosa HHB12029]